MSKGIAAVVSKMVAELEALKTDEERERAFAGARAVLGMGAAAAGAGSSGGGAQVGRSTSINGLSSAGAAWIRRAGISEDRINEFFHVEDGKVTLIGEPPGKSKREKTINTYLLVGVASLLESGNPDFTDAIARQSCVDQGCYDGPNHSKALGEFGNNIAGSKSTGWKLTKPGLSKAAQLIDPKAKAE